MRPDDIVRLTHMRDAAASALRFIDGKERADLDRNEMLLFAPVRAVEVIGEAAAKVSVEGRAEIPGIRWAAIVGMRNRLALGYGDRRASSIEGSAVEGARWAARAAR